MKYAIAHIADIHYKSNEPEGVSSVLKLLLEDLKNQKENLSEYNFYVAISGDIVFSGSEAEAYSGFKTELDQKLESIGISIDSRIIVPRNHDIDRTIVENKFEDYEKNIGKNSESEPEFNSFIEQNEDLKFENYELFESEFAKYGNTDGAKKYLKIVIDRAEQGTTIWFGRDKDDGTPSVIINPYMIEASFD